MNIQKLQSLPVEWDQLLIMVAEEDMAIGIFHPGLVSTDMIGGNGDISPDVAATRIAGLIDKLTISNSGTFWH